MPQTTEELIVVTLRAQLADLGAPVTGVVEGVASLETLEPGTVQLTPLRMPHDPAAGGQSRYHLTLIVAAVTTLGEADALHSRLGNLFTLARAITEALISETMRSALRPVGGLDIRREPLGYWIKPPGRPGDKCGSLEQVVVDFVH